VIGPDGFDPEPASSVGPAVRARRVGPHPFRRAAKIVALVVGAVAGTAWATLVVVRVLDRPAVIEHLEATRYVHGHELDELADQVHEWQTRTHNLELALEHLEQRLEAGGELPTGGKVR